MVFEDQPEFITNLSQGAGTAALDAADKLSRRGERKDHARAALQSLAPCLGVKIRQNPGPGEYRYLQFAWKKQGGERICLQVNTTGSGDQSPR